MNLGKSFVIFFLVTSLAWIAANYVILRDFPIGWPIFIGNVLISGLVGWWWYKRSYHARFSWDQEGFELQWGSGNKSSKEWQDFSRVSLFHEGYGRFVVRLYQDDGARVDIPASDLKLDPSDFRFEVMELIESKSPAEGSRNAGKES
ncbi:MAG: hypothetical protein CEE40_05915 [Chloroflexi bacterium B3_Chlor]|nr:MAG: hypothetical protein CEE40_05915 [Chloroflexi bacterium B3_Chlor]